MSESMNLQVLLEINLAKEWRAVTVLRSPTTVMQPNVTGVALAMVDRGICSAQAERGLLSVEGCCRP